jgi:hypothetical protein
MRDQPGSVSRLVGAGVLLAAAFVVSLVFYGTAVNLVVLAVVVALLLLALGCVGPGGIEELLQSNRAGFALACAALAYLIIAYRLSLSPDNSFAPSWVIAALPMAFICGLAVSRQPAALRLTTLSFAAPIIALATMSSVRFVVWGERAHEPMIDSNHYATLMYLVWIPLVHRHLTSGWRRDSMTAVEHRLTVASSFVLLLSIIATYSRTSQLIVVGAFVAWALIAAIRHLAWRRLILHVVIALVACIVAFAASVVNEAAASKGIEFGGGAAVRQELIRAAFAMLAQYPLGIGVFCFPLLYPSFRSPLEQDTAGLFVHNDYVQFLVEGGVPLLLLLLLFVGLLARRAVALLRVAPTDPRFSDLGLAIALLAVCAHATVNFVFYSLPLCLVIGASAAALFATHADRQRGSETARLPRRSVAIAIGVAWVMWLYLVLDVAVVGVFQDQPAAGFVTSIRGDEKQMLRFSRIAQRLNGNRGIPALGEAVLLYRAARVKPESRYLKDRTYEQFHRAMEVDPWNPLIYVRLSQFLDEFVPPGERRPGESDEDLLLSALGLDPLFLPAIDQLLQHYASMSRDTQRYALLRGLVYPWMDALRRSDPEACERYFDLLEGYARSAKDDAFLAEVVQRRVELANVVPKRQAYWLF